LSITAPESTPRISSTSIRPTGWRYAMIASVSSAAGDRRVLVVVRHPKLVERRQDRLFPDGGVERAQLFDRQRARRGEQRRFKQLRERLHA
jgi:hypothetical protein